MAPTVLGSRRHGAMAVPQDVQWDTTGRGLKPTPL
jgi:hypothetical protein